MCVCVCVCVCVAEEERSIWRSLFHLEALDPVTMLLIHSSQPLRLDNKENERTSNGKKEKKKEKR